MNTDNGLLVLGGPDIQALLEGRKRAVVDAVRQAYIEHQAGNSCLPHSVFVRFPGRVKERIIALPAYHHRPARLSRRSRRDRRNQVDFFLSRQP